MPKNKMTIRIVGENLKTLLHEKGGGISASAKSLGVTNPAIYDWIKKGKISPTRLLELIKTFELTSEDVDSLRVRSNISLQFRAHNHNEVPNSIRERVKEMVKEATVHQKLVPGSDRSLSTLSPSSVSDAAQDICRILGIDFHPITTSHVIACLNAFNIPVLFFPFDKELTKLRVKGFAATCDNKHFIFLDSNLKLEDVLWNLLHEVTHVFLGNRDGHHSEEEDFCNKVASEILLPTAFLKKEKIRKVAKIALKKAGYLSIQLVDELSTASGASFEGVILALIENGLLNKKSDVTRYLYGVKTNRQKSSITVSDEITPKKRTRLTEFWTELLQDPSRCLFVQYHELVLQGLMAGKTSLGRAAEVFDVDVMTMQDIYQGRGMEYVETAAID